MPLRLENRERKGARLALPLSRYFSWLVLFSAAALLLCPSARPQAQPQNQQAEEIYANLDAGRVVIGVAKEGIVIATLENPIEAGTRPPAIVQLTDTRVAIMLGAVDWWLPDQGRELARFDLELPTLPFGEGGPPAPHLQPGGGAEATDIEQISKRLQYRLAEVAGHIHTNLNFSEDEPLVDMLITDYMPEYGPEVWLVRFPIEQEPLQGAYWQTNVLSPQYEQLWPPEKGQFHGLVEFNYPRDTVNPSLMQLLQSGDPRLARALSGSPELQSTAESILNGDITKLPANDVAALLRACLGAIAAPKARMIEAEINEKPGVGWFIRPPKEIARPGSELARPSGAPSLVRPAGKPPGPGQR
jgi:hypothetical protein